MTVENHKIDIAQNSVQFYDNRRKHRGSNKGSPRGYAEKLEFTMWLCENSKEVVSIL